MGGLPPKVLSGYVFLRMFKNLVCMLVYPLFLHTWWHGHTFLPVFHMEEKPFSVDFLKLRKEKHQSGSWEF